MDNKILNKLSTFFLYVSILTFIIAFNFAHNPPSGWYQQFMPNLNGAPISDITFLDSLTGYAVTNVASGNSYILKTTNGGNNWDVKFTHTISFVRIQFINSSTGFTNAFQTIYKTTNGGDNWSGINLPTDLFGEDMFVLNEDTIWLVNTEGLVGGVFRTTNGGDNWTRQFTAGFGNPNKIYMFNRDIGFISGNDIWKTTNSGVNWTRILTNTEFSDMYFIDSLTGWKSNEDIQRTTNGGINWTTLPLPPKGTPVIYNGTILLSRIKQFSNVNKDTIWGVGSEAFFGAGRSRGLIYKSTDGGNTWGFQLPDTNINIPFYFYSNFINRLNGWSYHLNTGIHTVTGGDSITYTKINSLFSGVPMNFYLNQNYPNPFNPKTVISYELAVSSFIILKVYDILGNEVATLVNGKKNAGSYSVEFDGSGLSSGVYFYSLFIDGQRVDTKKMVLVR